MGIKSAKQSGNQVAVKTERSYINVSGKLIEFTDNALYVLMGQTIHTFKYDGRNFSNIGKHHTLNGGEAVMYGTYVGIKKGNRITLYDEKGNSAGVKSV